MAKTPQAPANMSFLFTGRKFLEATRTPAPASLSHALLFPAVIITDSTPPSVPQNLTATAVSTSQINLSWSASTDTGGSGLQGYRVYRNGSGAPLISQAGTTYSDTGLTISTLYDYRVTAYDAQGNESALSSLASATTLSSSGPNPDLTSSATVTGQAKSLAAGFIVPVGWGDVSRKTGGRILQMSAIGTGDLYFERVLGETGAISVTVATFASTNTVAGTNYTTVSQTVSFADGEIGWKRVSVPVLAIPTGFGIIGVQITGTAAYHRYCYIWLQGTGHVANAKYLRSLGAGIDSSNNTSGNGSAATPWRSPYYAASQMGNAGGVLYVQSSGGNFYERRTRFDYVGAFQFENDCTVASPLIVVADPDNVTVPIFDNQVALSDTDTKAICWGVSPTAVWLVGLTCRNGGIYNHYSAGLGPVDNVVWKCDVGQWRAIGSNNAAIRFDWQDRFIVQDCYLHEIYSTEPGNSNPFDSVPSGVHEGAHAFRAQNCQFVHCKFSILEYGAFEKNAPSTTTQRSVDVSHCYFEKCLNGAITYQNQGDGTESMQNGLVRYNVYAASGSGQNSTRQLVFMPKQVASSQSGPIDVFGNVARTAGRMFHANEVTGCRVFNNISEDTGDVQIVLGLPSSGKLTQLLHSDFNLYVRGVSTWVTHYGSTITYSSLTAWKAVTNAADSYVAAQPDQNSTQTNTTPAYTNIATLDFTCNTTPLGRGGRRIGLGSELVGIVNT